MTIAESRHIPAPFEQNGRPQEAKVKFIFAEDDPANFDAVASEIAAHDARVILLEANGSRNLELDEITMNFMSMAPDDTYLRVQGDERTSMPSVGDPTAVGHIADVIVPQWRKELRYFLAQTMRGQKRLFYLVRSTPSVAEQMQRRALIERQIISVDEEFSQMDSNLGLATYHRKLRNILVADSLNGNFMWDRLEALLRQLKGLESTHDVYRRIAVVQASPQSGTYDMALQHGLDTEATVISRSS